MIVELILENFLFIEKAELSFSSGLNVITGETGAGKSILLEAVKLLLGKKAKRGLVLPGCKKANIQALFDISGQTSLIQFLTDNNVIDEEEPNLLSISRSFRKEASGKILVNGILTSVSLLKKIGPSLMEIHGQNDHQTLLQPDVQMNLLDRSGGQKLRDKLFDLRSLFNERKYVQNEYEKLENQQSDIANRIKELHEISKELATLGINSIEEENDLKEESKKLEHAEQILMSLKLASACLSGENESVGASELLRKAVDALKNIADYDSRFSTVTDKTNDIYYDIREIESEIISFSEETSLNPDRLYEIQARLSEISRCCRKYNTNFAGLFELKENANKELETLYEPDVAKKKIVEKLNKLNLKLNSLASEVTQIRKKLSKKLATDISTEMSVLGFNSSKFSILLNPIKEVTSSGAETVEFHVSLNPGIPGGPLRKIASGGELSRVALAIKKVFAKWDSLPTLLFDEIDAGIGGKTAEAVASSLSKLGVEKQVLLVTHLHQIAKEGACHFTVSKSIRDDNTQVTIQQVEDDERVEEIARMLGRTDEKGIEFATSLLNKQ